MVKISFRPSHFGPRDQLGKHLIEFHFFSNRWHALLLKKFHQNFGSWSQRRNSSVEMECYTAHLEWQSNLSYFAPLYCTCLGFNGLLALPIKVGGKKTLNQEGKGLGLSTEMRVPKMDLPIFMRHKCKPHSLFIIWALSLRRSDPALLFCRV